MTRALVQTVATASVSVGNDVIASIGRGLLVYVGIAKGDEGTQVRRLGDKVISLRLLSNEEGRPFMTSVSDAQAEVLVVSNFTLVGDANSGRRPSWSAAAPPDVAEPLIQELVSYLRAAGVSVSEGVFGAEMVIEAAVSGPLNLVLDFES